MTSIQVTEENSYVDTTQVSAGPHRKRNLQNVKEKILILGQVKELQLHRNKNNCPVPQKAYNWQSCTDPQHYTSPVSTSLYHVLHGTFANWKFSQRKMSAEFFPK